MESEADNKYLIVTPDKELPPVGTKVIVCCGSFRCLGYRDAQGVWRAENNSHELTDVVGWMSLDPYIAEPVS